MAVARSLQALFLRIQTRLTSETEGERLKEGEGIVLDPFPLLGDRGLAQETTIDGIGSLLKGKLCLDMVTLLSIEECMTGTLPQTI